MRTRYALLRRLLTRTLPDRCEYVERRRSDYSLRCLRRELEPTGALSGAFRPSGAVLGCPEATGVAEWPPESLGFSVVRDCPEVPGSIPKLNVVGSIPITRSI